MKSRQMQIVIDAIFEKNRGLPTGGPLPKRTFGIPQIDTEVEYQILDSSWYSLGDSILPNKRMIRNAADYALLAYYGENLMAGTYLITKMGYPEFWGELAEKIGSINYSHARRERNHYDFTSYFRKQKIRNYYCACACEGYFGAQRGFIFDYALRRQPRLISSKKL